MHIVETTEIQEIKELQVSTQGQQGSRTWEKAEVKDMFLMDGDNGVKK